MNGLWQRNVQFRRGNLGLAPGNPAALRGCERLWDRPGVEDGIVLPLSTSARDTCVAGMFVALAVYFGYENPQIDGMIDWTVGQQMSDGGWNCRVLRSGAVHGSYHTSIIHIPRCMSSPAQ